MARFFMVSEDSHPVILLLFSDTVFNRSDFLDAASACWSKFRRFKSSGCDTSKESVGPCPFSSRNIADRTDASFFDPVPQTANPAVIVNIEEADSILPERIAILGQCRYSALSCNHPVYVFLMTSRPSRPHLTTKAARRFHPQSPGAHMDLCRHFA